MKPELRKGLRTWIEVDRDAMARNFHVLKSGVTSGAKYMSVVKSNAYGHSLIDFSKEVAKLGADWLGVDSMVEAIALRKEGVLKPILVLGYTLPEMIPAALEHNVSITVSTFETLNEIGKLAPKEKIKVHIKVDTGMSRQGFLPADTSHLISQLTSLEKFVVVEGLFTHLAAAKNPAFPQQTRKQLEVFDTLIHTIKRAGHKPIIHAAASAGAILYPDARFDMVRIGAAQYGVWPAKEVEAFAKSRLILQPILSWKTVISEVKKFPRGTRVGYDFTDELAQESQIAVCPIGYWHGFPRALSSIGEVLVGGKRARVVGRVSMDMISIDVTGIRKAVVGEEVVIIGESQKEKITIDDMARMCDTSPYEIVTRLNPLIKRIYI